jgi:hypothetical protein
VVAGFGEGRERMLHFSLPCNVAMRARCCQPQLAGLYGISRRWEPGWRSGRASPERAMSAPAARTHLAIAEMSNWGPT